MRLLRGALPFALLAFLFFPWMTAELFAGEGGDSSGGAVVTQDEDLIIVEWPGGLATELPPLLKLHLDQLRLLMEALRQRYLLMLEMLKKTFAHGSKNSFQRNTHPLSMPAPFLPQIRFEEKSASTPSESMKKEVEQVKDGQSLKAGDTVRPRGLFLPSAARYAAPIAGNRDVLLRGSR